MAIQSCLDYVCIGTRRFTFLGVVAPLRKSKISLDLCKTTLVFINIVSMYIYCLRGHSLTAKCGQLKTKISPDYLCNTSPNRGRVLKNALLFHRITEYDKYSNNESDESSFDADDE